MASLKLTLGILSVWEKLRKQRLDSQRAMESQPTGSATMGLASAAISPSISPNANSSAASVTSEAGSPPSLADFSTSELRAPGISMTDSTLIDIPMINSPPPHVSHRSRYPHGPGGR